MFALWTCVGALRWGASDCVAIAGVTYRGGALAARSGVVYLMMGGSPMA